MLCRAGLILFSILLLTGCASTAKRQPADRSFIFERDTFSFGNELVWEYEIIEETGERTKIEREETPEYHHYCFPMVRAARQFFDFAEFRPDERPVDTEETINAIEQVVDRGVRSDPTKKERVVIRGHAGLRALSTAHEIELKDAVGGKWQSWFQRGHWRLVFPFGRNGQEERAEDFVNLIEQGHTPIVHLIRFPSLSINHAVLLFEVVERGESLLFSAYDPNTEDCPLMLEFRKSDKTFYLPATASWKGGRVDVYEVFKNAVY